MLFIVSGLLLSSVFASLNGSPVRVERSDPDPTANTTTGTTDLSELSDFDLEHTMAINQQNSIINTGQIVSNAITNAITRPFTYINNQVSSAVSTLPGIFAANGAVLGTMIATPIQLGSLAFNSFITGLTGTFVSVPISLVSGGTAHVIGVVESGRQLFQTQFTDSIEHFTSSIRNFTLNNSTLANTTLTGRIQVLLQPLVQTANSSSILVGVNEGVKNIGQRVEQIGLRISNAGNNARRLSSVLIGWVHGRPLYLNNVDLDQFPPIKPEQSEGKSTGSVVVVNPEVNVDAKKEDSIDSVDKSIEEQSHDNELPKPQSTEPQSEVEPQSSEVEIVDPGNSELSELSNEDEVDTSDAELSEESKSNETKEMETNVHVETSTEPPKPTDDRENSVS